MGVEPTTASVAGGQSTEKTGVLGRETPAFQFVGVGRLVVWLSVERSRDVKENLGR
jgi:hypothetical protein